MLVNLDVKSAANQHRKAGIGTSDPRLEWQGWISDSRSAGEGDYLPWGQRNGRAGPCPGAAEQHLGKGNETRVILICETWASHKVHHCGTDIGPQHLVIANKVIQRVPGDGTHVRRHTKIFSEVVDKLAASTVGIERRDEIRIGVKAYKVV